MTDCLTGCIVQEELSHGCAGLGNLITSNGFFAEPVLALGTPRAAGALDPAAGAASARRSRRSPPPSPRRARTPPSIRTTARRTDGGYVLSGQKAWISNGGAADYYVVFATVAPGTRARGDHGVRARARRPRA